MRTNYLLILLSCAFIATISHANTVVFKSKDAAGRVSYSDTAPEDTIAYERIEIKQTTESDNGELDKRLDRMAATTKRLQEDRKQRELAGKAAPQQTQDTVVYYPAKDPGHSHYRRNNHHNRKRRGFFHDNPNYHDPYVSNHRRRSGTSSLDIGYRGSRFNGSLQLRDRSSPQRRQLPYSPLLKHRQTYN